MATAEGNHNRVVQVPNLSADLLQRFIVTSNHFSYRNPKNGDKLEEEDDDDGEEEGEEVELTLGLSLNGRFGTDPRSKKRKGYNNLARSSSIPEGFVAVREQRDADGGGGGGERRRLVLPGASDTFQLGRTRSLPVETEELQRLRRMEAKRRRSEKTRAFRAFHAPLREEAKSRLDDASGLNYGFAPGRVAGIDGAKRRSFGQNDDFAAGRVFGGKGGSGAEAGGENGNVLCSVGCRNGGSSGSSEFDIHEPKQKPACPPEKNPEVFGRARVRSILENMPCVATREAGPDGKRVEGFLYRYGKGEEVRIMCVCHGSFLSPAEFVKHGGAAGAGDVVNPLRHIVVSSASLL